MYGCLWRTLPGPWPARLVAMLALLIGALALLFYVIFPVTDPHLPFNRVTVNQGPTTTPRPSPSSSP